MTAHPTPILQTTRSGSRGPVRWLNQPACQDKGEPKRRSACAGARARIVEPDAKSSVKNTLSWIASLLLVILHYLLKNNSTFMGLRWSRLDCPPQRLSADVRVVPVHGGWQAE
jgi:hypothetical protein